MNTNNNFPLKVEIDDVDGLYIIFNDKKDMILFFAFISPTYEEFLDRVLPLEYALDMVLGGYSKLDYKRLRRSKRLMYNMFTSNKLNNGKTFLEYLEQLDKRYGGVESEYS